MNTPSRRYYLVAVGIAAVGLAVSLGLGLTQVGSRLRGMQRMVMPGEHEVALEAGEQTVYFETESTIDGESFVTSAFSLRCAVFGDDGSPLELRSSSATTSYTMFGFTGKSVWKLDVPRSGRYRFACEPGADPGAGRGVVAIGPGLGWLIGGTIAGALGSVAFGVLAFVVVFVKRRRARRAAEASPVLPGAVARA